MVWQFWDYTLAYMIDILMPLLCRLHQQFVCMLALCNESHACTHVSIYKALKSKTAELFGTNNILSLLIIIIFFNVYNCDNYQGLLFFPTDSEYSINPCFYELKVVFFSQPYWQLAHKMNMNASYLRNNLDLKYMTFYIIGIVHHLAWNDLSSCMTY